LPEATLQELAFYQQTNSVRRHHSMLGAPEQAPKTLSPSGEQSLALSGSFKWVGSPIGIKQGNTFYRACEISGMQISLGAAPCKIYSMVICS